MKTIDRYRRLLFMVLMCGLLSPATENAVAQEERSDFARSAIYVEVLGQGILYSVNYDHRISQHFSLRAGYSHWSMPFVFIDKLTFTGFPIMLNYLTGEGTGHLELGIGLMPTTVSLHGREWFFGTQQEASGSIVLGTATIGYRSQSQDGGFVFRIGVTPIFTFKEVLPSGGISLGFAF